MTTILFPDKGQYTLKDGTTWDCLYRGRNNAGQCLGLVVERPYGKYAVRLRPVTIRGEPSTRSFMELPPNPDVLRALARALEEEARRVEDHG